VLDGGLLASLLAGRRGRGSNSPPQLGQMPPSAPSAHAAQKVHSNEQMRASVESGGKSLSHRSQPGLSSSIYRSFRPSVSGMDLRFVGEFIPAKSKGQAI
jgi:hypothetical protein